MPLAPVDRKQLVSGGHENSDLVFWPNRSFALRALTEVGAGRRLQNRFSRLSLPLDAVTLGFVGAT